MNGMQGHLFNIIIYTTTQKSFRYFHSLVHRLVEKFPCRVIFVEVDQTCDTLSVESCETSALGCEELMIHTPPHLQERVPFILLEKLVPDLPTYLIWGHNPADNSPILTELLRLVDRFVYDPTMAKDPIAFAKAMTPKIHELNIEFMDIEWAKTRGWRDAIADMFNSEMRFTHLKQTEEIVVYSTTPGVQEVYIQGWMAALLEWTPKQQMNNQILYQDQKILFEYKARPNIPERTVFEIDLYTSNGFKYTFSLQEKQHKIFTYCSTDTICELPVIHTIPDLEKGLSFMKEIFYLKTSPHYLKTLNLLSKFGN